MICGRWPSAGKPNVAATRGWRAVVCQIGGNQRVARRRLRMPASAVARTARDRLLAMQIRLCVPAPTRIQADGRPVRLVDGFEVYASWRNWLRPHRP